MTIYYAYGANTNIDGMKYRCPKSKLLGTLDLPDWRLVFKGVADIEVAPHNKVNGVLWEITEECERSLDRFEGYPNLYRKEYFQVQKGDGTIVDIMFYKMNREGYAPPSDQYFECIETGYRQNDIPTDLLWQSLHECM